MTGLTHRWHDCYLREHGTRMRLATHPVTDDLYRWEGGAWRNLTPTFARTILREAHAGTASEHAVKEALFILANREDYLEGDTHGLDSDSPRINFANGIYDLASGDLLPHGEPWFTVNQIPHNYRDDMDDVDLELATIALDTLWGKQMAQDVVDARVPWQIYGLAMIRGNLSQTLVILQGPGGSGKSTYVALLIDLLGDDNVSTLTLAQLGDRFEPMGLHGTLANVAGDVVGGVVPAYELILSIVGGDKITADRKHRTLVSFDWDGLLILATNGRLILPPGAGPESGWWRRALYIDMPHAVAQEQRETPRELREAIAPDLDIVATRAARELRTAWLSRSAPSVTASMAEASAAARISSDTVADWVDDRLKPHEGSQVEGKAAYQDYAAWCRHYGHKPRGHQNFYADLDAVLVRRGWGKRLSGRSSTSRVNFGGIFLEARQVWQHI